MKSGMSYAIWLAGIFSLQQSAMNRKYTKVTALNKESKTSRWMIMRTREMFLSEDFGRNAPSALLMCESPTPMLQVTLKPAQ
jgi:hypothetical protein